MNTIKNNKGKMEVVTHVPKLPNPKEIEKSGMKKPIPSPTFVIDKKPI